MLIVSRMVIRNNCLMSGKFLGTFFDESQYLKNCRRIVNVLSRPSHTVTLYRDIYSGRGVGGTTTCWNMTLQLCFRVIHYLYHMCYGVSQLDLDSLYCYSVTHTHTLMWYILPKRQGYNYCLLSHCMFYVFYSLLSATLLTNALHVVAFNLLPIRETLIKLL